MISHTYQFRVRYRDVDYLGVVYYSRYLEYFEAARDELMRALGMPYSVFEASGIAMPVVEVNCRYLRGARFDELLTVASKITEFPGARLRIDYSITGEIEPCQIATGYTVHAFINQSHKAVKPPGPFIRLVREKWNMNSTE